MSTDTPAEPPPWVTGPPPGYDPPPLEALVDPAVREQHHTATHEAGRAACLAAIHAATGKTRTPDGHWVDDTDTTHREGARP